MKITLGPAWAALLLVLTSAPGRGDTLDDIRQRGVLRWGGDQEGGGPYIYSSGGAVAGFEVELMDLVAERLGVRAEFKQGDWDKLPNLLRSGDIDAAVNGYELTSGRISYMSASLPYYVYELQLMARANDDSIRCWEDLKRGNKRRLIGVLQGSAAETYVNNRLGEHVEVRGYAGNTDAMREVETGQLDATLQDLPIVIYNEKRFPNLRAVDTPVAPGYYVIYLRKNDTRLREEINSALLELVQNGKLRALYKRYGIWNASQEQLGTLYRAMMPERFRDIEPTPDAPSETTAVQSTRQHGWQAISRNLPILASAAGMTILLTVLSMPLAVALGLCVALGRLYGPVPLRWLLTGYVELLRGTPLLLQLFAIFFIIRPWFGIQLDPRLPAILGLAINYSAYEAEIYRAGLMAIPGGQMEAALSLGMSRWVALRRIIVPQAFRLVIPPVTNDFIALFKDTSICSVITVVELSKQYSILANDTGAYIELAALTALLYLLMSYPLSLVARKLEKKTPRIAA